MLFGRLIRVFDARCFWEEVASGALQAGASILGGYLSGKSSEKIAQKNIDAQYDFAKNSIKWKVNDAKQAGIHPLYALGASGSSYSPVTSSGYDIGQGIADAGDAISRSVSSYKSHKHQQEQLAFQKLQGESQIAMNKEQIKGIQLDNKIKEQRLMDMQTASIMQNNDASNPASNAMVSQKSINPPPNADNAILKAFDSFAKSYFKGAPAWVLREDPAQKRYYMERQGQPWSDMADSLLMGYGNEVNTYDLMYAFRQYLKSKGIKINIGKEPYQFGVTNMPYMSVESIPWPHKVLDPRLLW